MPYLLEACGYGFVFLAVLLVFLDPSEAGEAVTVALLGVFIAFFARKQRKEPLP